MKGRKKVAGISLVALVVTIIVLIILTGAVIVTFMDGGIIDRANESVFKNDIRSYQEVLAIKIAEEKVKVVTDQDYNSDILGEEITDYSKIKEIIPEYKDEYIGIFKISSKGELVVQEDASENNANYVKYEEWIGELGLLESSSGDNTGVALDPNWDNSQDYLFDIDGNGILRGVREEYCEKLYEGEEDFIIYADENKETVLTKVTIPNKIGDIVVTGLADNIFKYNQSIKEIVIPSTVRSIGNSAFECSADLESITISEGLETIGKYAFADVYDMESIVLPSTLTNIGAHAFSCCSIKSMTILSENFTLGEEVFGWDYEMTEIKVVNETVQNRVKEAIESDETCELSSDIVTIIED